MFLDRYATTAAPAPMYKGVKSPIPAQADINPPIAAR